MQFSPCLERKKIFFRAFEMETSASSLSFKLTMSDENFSFFFFVEGGGAVKYDAVFLKTSSMIRTAARADLSYLRKANLVKLNSYVLLAFLTLPIIIIIIIGFLLNVHGHRQSNSAKQPTSIYGNTRGTTETRIVTSCVSALFLVATHVWINLL